jgi:hypothetical protein
MKVSYYFVIYKNKPWELLWLTTKERNQEQITFSTTPEFNAYAWRTPEVMA